jgi:hypothetical protein
MDRFSILLGKKPETPDSTRSLPPIHTHLMDSTSVNQNGRTYSQDAIIRAVNEWNQDQQQSFIRNQRQTGRLIFNAEDSVSMQQFSMGTRTGIGSSSPPTYENRSGIALPDINGSSPVEPLPTDRLGIGTTTPQPEVAPDHGRLYMAPPPPDLRFTAIEEVLGRLRNIENALAELRPFIAACNGIDPATIPLLTDRSLTHGTL